MTDIEIATALAKSAALRPAELTAEIVALAAEIGLSVHKAESPA
jgi:hypothetical protein